MANEPSIGELVQAARGGNLDAFGCLVQMFQSQVRGFIAMLGVPPDSVEDVAQDTFLTAWKSMPDFKIDMDLGPWLRGIARNMVRRFHARKANDARIQQSLVARVLAEREPDPSLFEVEAGFGRHLSECLKRLPVKMAELVRARYDRSQSSLQIAEQTHSRPEAVRMALMRTRDALRRCVQEQVTRESI
jgi:RNA polymerase sigma-70 factor (ECF subfamily)